MNKMFSSMSVPLDWWKTFFEIGGVTLLFLTFVFGAGLLIVDRRINALQAEELRKFDKDLTEAKTQLSVQQTRAADAERQLELVKKKQAPRGVPINLILTTKNAPHQKLLVEYQDGPPEIKLFTDLLCQTMKSANWEILGPTPIPSVAAKGAGNSEITILWPSGRNPDAAFDVLSETFRKAGWSVSGAANPDVPSGALIILIGPR